MIQNNTGYIRLGILFLMGAFGIMGGGLLAPALPSLVVPFNIEEGTVGLVLSVYTFSAALTLPVTGMMIDILGRRKVALICLVIDGVFGLLCTIAPNFTVLLIFRFFQGIGIAALIPVAVTVISDWYHGSERLKIMGYMSGTISMCAVFIPVIGGFLAAVNWKYPFMVYGLSLVLALFYYCIIPESSQNAGLQDKGNKIAKYVNSLRSVMVIPTVRLIFFHALVLYFLLYSMINYFPLLLHDSYGLSLRLAGFALGFQALMSSIIASQASRLDRFMSRKAKLVSGYFLLFLGLVLIPVWGDFYQLLLSLVLLGIGMGILMPALYHWATTAGPRELVGSVIALFTTVKFIGMTLAPVILRYIYNVYGPEGTFIAASVVAIIWCLRIFLSIQSEHRSI